MVRQSSVPFILFDSRGKVLYRNAASSLVIPVIELNGREYIGKELSLYLKNRTPKETFSYKYARGSTSQEFLFEGRRLRHVFFRVWLVSAKREMDRPSVELVNRRGKVLFHRLIRDFPDAIGMTDQNLVYEACNIAFVKALGIDDPNKLVGKTLREVADKEIADKFAYSDLNVLNTGKEFRIIDEVIDENGNKQWIEGRKIKYKDPVTQIPGLFIMARDVTEREQAKEQLKRATLS